jgi:DNA invertase Pin-like site-specific DNA recombinase
LRAALYVRASTAAQTLSPALQEEFLRRHGASHGMQVVRRYLDRGRRLAGQGMPQLLADVCDGSADYQVLLVYDVSRWGRYQNIDEAECYEFLCRRAGIQVHYCAEPFANDGRPLSQLVKSYKRSMAAEYSRELSYKVFAGLRLLAQHGYKLGGLAPYGMQGPAYLRAV